MMADIATRVAQLGLVLPALPSPRGAYLGAVVHDGIVYVSGQVSRVGDEVVTGPVDRNTPDDVIRNAAQACVLRALSVLAATAAPTASVERILFLRGFVNSTPDFRHHGRVMDFVSTLLYDIFGESGRCARSAVGVASLPDSGLLEIELTVTLTPEPRLRL
ncbi:RidA family protein [Paraburkholderia megapolitana]|uniref:Enamine deaminase RidA, house cleaning of reactive enamine intermediates, YjgF/YER057c/UK114 family n=1 Tax=Paraburkholderia megapolitana TaxID=420953 RepID=A0A1I3D8L6_9BURK|nr:RidA family protein [Paraburkholderia megapolitana]SFH83057.1 Enamine deaminase RidA, house cleaning of reactive enamine intermediates, YjgF/YER057c/UK114 family [Paraburkholderia megapolitana]